MTILKLHTFAAIIAFATLVSVAAVLNGVNAGSAQGVPVADTNSALQSPFAALASSDLDVVCVACLAEERAGVGSRVTKSKSKVSAPLAQLIYTAAVAGASGTTSDSDNPDVLPKSLRDLVNAKMLRLDDGGRVEIYVRASGELANAVGALTASGSDVTRTNDESGIAQAWVPVTALATLAEDERIGRMTLPDYGFVQSGSLNSEGDNALNAASARAAFGVDGAGVRVGVVSDGVEGILASQASGDLPDVNITACDVVAGSPVGPGAGAEGTAMLEIVHDLAPGAELWFGYFGMGSVLDFNAAVNCLADHVDVIIDDIAFFNVGPYDGTSSVSVNTREALQDESNRVRGYYNAVGNSAISHYQELFVNGGSAYHSFQATGSTVDQAPFGQRLDTPVFIPEDTVSIVLLQWDDPFGASCNDYDLFAWEHDTGFAITSSIDPQECFEDPVEGIVLDNTGGPATIVDVGIQRFFGQPRTLEMFLLNAYPNYNTRCNSVPNNSDAGGRVISLAAINVHDVGLDDPEEFSSCGPTNDGRIKPDASAVDNVSVTGNGGFPSPFTGTSAAAPHAGAIAALLLDCNPSLTRDSLRSTLLSTAVDIGSGGPDNVFGHGRLDALSALTLAGCEAGEPPTATLTATLPPTDTPTVEAPATETPTPTAVPPTDTPTRTPSPTRTPTRTPTAQPPSSFVAGDASCDGQVNSIDASLILQYAAGLLDEVPCEEGADANGDRNINSLDAALVLQYGAGILDELPA